MKHLNLLLIIFLSITTLSCNDEKKDPTTLFSLKTSAKNDKIIDGESVTLSLINEKNLEIGVVSYYLNDKKTNSNTIKFSNTKLGVKHLKATFSYQNKLVVIKKDLTVLSKNKPKVFNFEIINTYPHDIHSYTQGLEFYNDVLYESTGQYGKSSLRKVNYKTGEVIQNINLDAKHFGEGLTILNNKLYQLTWRAGIGFVYNPEDLTKTKTFEYHKSNEGWGICNDGKTLYKSDGTEKIWNLNPTTLEEDGYIQIYTNTSKIKSVNELEWINGKIYANIYQKNGIAVINPKNGEVEAVINCNSLKNKVTQHDKIDVLNGIAYNPKTNTIFVTGKNWDKLFEIKITDYQTDNPTN